MGISNGLNQKTAIGIVAILIIFLSVYYFGGNNYKYGSQNPLINTLSITPIPQGPNQISIKNFAFSPAELSINKGDLVTWINNDSAAHRISGGGFQSGDLTAGQTYGFIFTSSGTFDYICGIHPGMKGRIIVK